MPSPSTINKLYNSSKLIPCVFPLFRIVFLLLCLSSAASSTHVSGGPQDDLFPEILRDEAVARLYELGKVSDGDGYLERTFLSPASIRAGNLIQTWMEDAGLTTWVDGLGSVHGRVEPPHASNKALLIGSHLDTVVDAGMYDGALGVICAISALKVLNMTGRSRNLRHQVESKCMSCSFTTEPSTTDICVSSICVYDRQCLSLKGYFVVVTRDEQNETT